MNKLAGYALPRSGEGQTIDLKLTLMKNSASSVTEKNDIHRNGELKEQDRNTV